MKKKKNKKVKMDKKEYEDEHINLIRILESGSLKERKAEAKRQRKELKDEEKD